MGFVQSKHDDALFNDTANETCITLYVDDIKVFAPTHALIDEVKEKRFATYAMTDEGNVKWYLGMEINHLPDGALLLNQAKYIDDLLERHGMENCSIVRTPMTETKLERAPDDYIADPVELVAYQTLLGEVMHFMVQTRPDLAQGVSRLAQFMSNPTNTHWLALKHILRYLQGTRRLGICFNKAIGNLIMEVWTDSSWGEDPNDSRSTSGYVVLMAGGPVAWKSTKQQSVALSSTEAEYMGQTAAATNVMRTRGLLKELQIKGTILENANSNLRR